MRFYPIVDFIGGPALAALLLLVLALETWRPLRHWLQSRWHRLLTNAGVAAVGTTALRLDVPQTALTIGVPAYRDPHELTVFHLLAMPFRRQRPTWLLPNGTHPDRRETGDPGCLAT